MKILILDILPAYFIKVNESNIAYINVQKIIFWYFFTYVIIFHGFNFRYLSLFD